MSPGFRPARAHQCVADLALDATTIGDFECLCPLGANPQLFEHLARNPRKLASGVYQRFRQFSPRTAPV